MPNTNLPLIVNQRTTKKDTAMHPQWLDEKLYPFQSRFMEIEGNQIHYVDEGRGPTLLLLHGNPTWSFLYRHIITHLSQRFRCVAVDYPGFGLSTARPGYSFKPQEHSTVIDRFVEALDLDEIGLMVQDWGGPIGLGFAGRHPDRIRALLIGNTWAWPAQGSQNIEGFSKIVGSPIGRFLILNFNAFVNLIVPMGVSRHLTPAEMRAYRGPFRTRVSRLPTAIFPREILHSREYLAEVEANLGRLSQKPTLILWGDQDLAFRETERERFQLLFPNHHTRILKGAKHFIQEDAPEQICEELSAFYDNILGKNRATAKVSSAKA
ncbi:MAG TPA: alpha/beta fold hydrolase [Anaerolineales bacterium]|nr:alpha/beta fold hydrolase [Anaerolineales bacterium]